ncbi:MAG: 4Fe-4S binding protein [Pelotomaculum sp.]|jgi:coenzyme F420-reducing hydrogenase beta subunit
MDKKRISIENCCGCGMCSMVCPTNAINMKYETGFPLPIIDKNKCIKCGKCYEHCPTYFEYKINAKVLAYGGWSLSKPNRMASTSGGIAFEIATHLIENGYKFMGVRFNVQKMCSEHYTTNRIDELDASRGSKYTTSHTMPALNELKQKINWVVFGTPCQIAAIDNYARKNNRREDFILIDMFCAGPPTEKLLHKYVLEECKKDKKNLVDITDVKFRDKSKYGWSIMPPLVKTRFWNY